MTKQEIRELKKEIHKSLVDIIYSKDGTSEEIDLLWDYAIYLAEIEKRLDKTQ